MVNRFQSSSQRFFDHNNEMFISVSASTQESLIVALSQNVVMTLDYWAMIIWVAMGKYLTNN
jgi:hypothetical protein